MAISDEIYLLEHSMENDKEVVWGREAKIED
jgi:hypothetical protein